MERIVIFGGSYDPPTCGHVMAAYYLLEQVPLDQLWVCPVYKHAFNKNLAPFDDRFQMCVKAFEAVPKVVVSKLEKRAWEDECNPHGLTRNLVKYAKKIYPSCTFRIVIGSDILNDLPQWDGSEELFTLAPPIVIGRPGYPITAMDPEVRRILTDAALYLPNAPLPAISSTEVRQRAGSPDRDFDHMVPGKVAVYIRWKGLYRDPVQ